MALDHVYKVLFYLQSAAFILFIINYSQKTPVDYKPLRKVDECNCKGNDSTRTFNGTTGYAAFASGQMPNYSIADVKERHDTVELTFTQAYDNRTGDAKLMTRGQLSNCTLDDIKKRPGVVMLTTTNFGFLDIALNMFESIKRTGVCVNTTVIAEDKKVYKYLSKRAEGDPGVTVLLTNSGETPSDAINRWKDPRHYYGLMNKRQAYILALLEQGFDVLFSDSDTFWFRDPFPYFEGDFDLSAIDPQSPYPTRTSKAHYCAGFVYYKPTNVSIQFLKAWIETMASNIKKGKIRPDQNVMNDLLLVDKPVHVTTKPLDTNIFPFGPKFYELLAKKANYSTVVMHAASIRGHEAKLEKFKSSDMWLINKTNDELLAEMG